MPAHIYSKMLWAPYTVTVGAVQTIATVPAGKLWILKQLTAYKIGTAAAQTFLLYLRPPGSALVQTQNWSLGPAGQIIVDFWMPMPAGGTFSARVPSGTDSVIVCAGGYELDAS